MQGAVLLDRGLQGVSVPCRPRVVSNVEGPLVISALDLSVTVRWSLQADALDLTLSSAEVHPGEIINLVMDLLEAELGSQTSSQGPSIPGDLRICLFCE